MKVASGKFKGRPLKTPKGTQTRPTSSKVRESVFNILQNEIEGARFLDLFAGSGAMGIEALSRGAKSSTFVEKNKLAAQCLRDNLKNLELRAPFFQADAFVSTKRFLKHGETFDIIYIDPPYSLDITPLFEILPSLLAEGGLLFIEQGQETPIPMPELESLPTRHFGDTYVHILRRVT